MKHPSSDKPELQRWLRLQGDADRRILAQLWDLPLHSDVAELAAALTEPQRVRNQWERLGDAERAALTRVLQDGGALPVAVVERDWGTIRDPQRFANPRAYLQALEAPASPAERLYSMALLVRDHDERGQVLRVLNDFRTLLPPVAPRERTLHVASAPQPAEVQAPELDQTERTLLALLRLAEDGALKSLDDGALNKASLVQVAKVLDPGSSMRGVRREADWPWIALMRATALESGLLHRTSDGSLQRGPQALEWLQADQAQRVQILLRGWIATSLSELKLFARQQWRSEPLSIRLPISRSTLLRLLATLPIGRWLAVADIAAEVERVEPDFLRRDGRFDNALIYDYRGVALAGRAAWPKVEGEFVRLVLLGPLHWLGLVDMEGGSRADLIRLTPLADYLLRAGPAPATPAAAPLRVQGTFEVICPPDAPLFARYQLARIAEVVSDETIAVYKLTRRSVLLAVEQGLAVDAIIAFLERYSDGPLPQAVVRYLHEWAGHVGELRLEEAALLRSDDPIRLLEIRRSKGVTLPSTEELTPTVWKVALGDAPTLLAQARRAGFSVEHDGDGSNASSRPAALSAHDLQALVTAAHAYAQVCAELNLPCEVSSSMLMRLRKLVPSRQIAAARQTAQDLAERIRGTTVDTLTRVGED